MLSSDRQPETQGDSKSLHRILILAFVTLTLALPSAAMAKGPKKKKVMLQCEVLGPHKVKVTNPGDHPIPKTAKIVVIRGATGPVILTKGATGPVIMKWKQQPQKVISPRDAIVLQLDGKGTDLVGQGNDLAGKPGSCEAWARVNLP